MLEDSGIPLVVAGMLLATLFMAAVLKRYQEYQARVRSLVQRIERGLNTIESALQILHAVPLTHELRVILYGDVVARYERIRVLYRKFPDLKERLQQARQTLQAQGPAATGGVGAIDSEQVFRQRIDALDQLIALIRDAETVRPVPQDVRRILLRELGERRAEVMARFHLVASRRLKHEGRASRARAHLTTLMQVLRSRGPSTDFVRELYREAQSALHDFDDHGATGGDPHMADDVARA